MLTKIKVHRGLSLQICFPTQAQQVAEISVEARETYQRAQQEVQEATDSLTSKVSLKEKLLETLERVSGEEKALRDVIKEFAERSMEER